MKKLGHPLLKVQIRYEPDIVTARQKTRRIADLLGFDNQDQARIATAVSELARNAFQYAGGGFVEFFFSDVEPLTFWIRISDSGPGIADLDDILNGTYISSTGMGVGFNGSKKLMDEFGVETAPGKGTKVVIGKFLDTKARLKGKIDLRDLVDKISTRQADNQFEEIQNQNRDLLNALAELRASKEELSELNRELAETNRGVVALYAELDEKAASLQRANEVKTSFLSNMTHEFRTPLSSIISLTRILLDRVDGDLSPEQERQVNYIRKSGESLLELVNDLLDLAKVEAGKVSVNASPFHIEELLGGVRGMFRPILGADAPVDFNVEWDESVRELETDQAKISQILRNLVSNAVKFTERGMIEVRAFNEGRGLIHFTVKDTGIGIAPENLNAIFEDFSQVDSKLQRRQKGTGLGLPLSRKLARLLGGDLWVESVVGEGSTFHAVIPRIYGGTHEAVLFSRGSAEAEKETEPAGAQFNVMLIDDDEPSRYVLKGLVGAELDAQFIEAVDGKDGLQKIQKAAPDLVFLDLGMPGIDGFQLLKTLRSNEKFRDIPVVVNTAKKLSPDESAFLTKEATAILSKDRTDHQVAVRDLRRALVKAGFDYKSM